MNNLSYGFKIASDRLSSDTRKMFNHTSLIQIGYVTTNGAQADDIGGSPRYGGRAEASNPFPLLIPCHRVVHADFSIGNYGLERES